MDRLQKGYCRWKSMGCGGVKIKLLEYPIPPPVCHAKGFSGGNDGTHFSGSPCGEVRTVVPMSG